MTTRPRDRLNLGRKITNVERAGNCTRQAVQSVESRPGSLQATSKAVAGAPQVAGKGRAENSRVKDNRVFDHIRNRPNGIHTLSTLCQPVCCPICHAEGLCPALAGVKLGEYGLCLYRIYWVVAHRPSTAPGGSSALTKSRNNLRAAGERRIRWRSSPLRMSPTGLRRRCACPRRRLAFP